MKKRSEEWLKQSNYDLATAEYMYEGGRYFYAVFMCHLSVEKALKGLYDSILDDLPPKTHNLVYLLTKMNIKPPEDMGKFLIKLNEANVATRYPEDINQLLKNFTKEIVYDIITKTKDSIRWISNQF